MSYELVSVPRLASSCVKHWDMLNMTKVCFNNVFLQR